MNIWIDSANTADILVYLAYEEESFPHKLGEAHKRSGSVAWLYGRSEEEPDVLAVGMGKRSGLTLEKIRRAAGSAARKAQQEGRSSASLVRMPSSDKDAAGENSTIAAADWLQAWTEGWLLGLYRFQAYREFTRVDAAVDFMLQLKEWPELTNVELGAVLEIARIRADGAMLARDRVNESPDTLNPDKFTEWMAEYFDRADLPVKVHVYKEQELADLQMNGLRAVGAGSKHSPALVEIRYEGNPELPMLALVGKGVTFDMGGMNVKTASDISDARMDMGGAAAVIGAMDILLRKRANVNVTALIPVVDNVPDAEAILPSSVIRYPNGLTVQVANTDGEGRLIIADALIHAANIGAAEVIDIATLTGNVGAALGLGIAGIWGDADMTRSLVEIGESNGERLWPMPLMDEYEADLRSNYADLRNVGTSSFAGAITAALFIRRFVAESMKWIHIDMAGTVQYKQDVGYSEVGATGYGARLLADYAMKQAALTKSI
ncbi:leucyl aminopeptidase [Paenibacillus endophyticus]|uniref:Probable cytosol aminopeptidase n=1 Tax=Paenibacillus endophyticus TaxID=1294268 RepID=A0A7W5GAV1_9BACL|nr:leucyl aminopeptidase family protein [Paenibacillus endophyticus]MBB3153669.1 leucyl aminopeptidase [Paenibacillus endophyticus]